MLCQCDSSKPMLRPPVCQALKANQSNGTGGGRHGGNSSGNGRSGRRNCGYDGGRSRTNRTAPELGTMKAKFHATFVK